MVSDEDLTVVDVSPWWELTITSPNKVRERKRSDLDFKNIRLFSKNYKEVWREIP